MSWAPEKFNYFDIMAHIVWGAIYCFGFALLFSKLRFKPWYLHILHYFYTVIIGCFIFAFIFIPLANSLNANSYPEFSYWGLTLWRGTLPFFIYFTLSLLTASGSFYYMYFKFSKAE